MAMHHIQQGHTYANTAKTYLALGFHLIGKAVFWLKSLHQLDFVCFFFGFYFQQSQFFNVYLQHISNARMLF
jgi:hypothetical protein